MLSPSLAVKLKEYASKKRWYLLISLHGVTAQKNHSVILTTAALKISNLTEIVYLKANDDGLNNVITGQYVGSY
jgi:hypothetical protein